MSYKCFDVQFHDHVAHISMKRADKRNSMVPAFWRELPLLVEELDQSGETRVIVLSSIGPHFTAGMDLSVFSGAGVAESTLNAARFYQSVKKLQHTFNSLELVRVPVLAAIQGGCIGAGVDMVTACDMRYATSDAFFTIQETNLAMTADVGTFPRLCKLIPDGLVRELAYTGRALSAAEARECGLVNAVFDDSATLLEGVMDIATKIASQSPMAIFGCKKMILHSRDHSVSETLDYVGLWNAGFFSRSDIAEAMQSKREDRTGRFTSLPAIPADDDDLLI